MNIIDDLDKALLAQKSDVPGDFNLFTLLSKLTKLPLEKLSIVTYVLQQHPEWLARVDVPLGAETKYALDEHIEAYTTSTKLAYAALNGSSVRVLRSDLVTDPLDVCRGCEVQLLCLSDRRSTPEKCLQEYSDCDVVLLRRGVVTLKTNHPDGTYTVALRVIHVRED